MVWAGFPLASCIRLAARPVGAHSSTSPSSSSRMDGIQRMQVVFPVPGPPVMTQILLLSAALTARRCWAPKRTPSRPS